MILRHPYITALNVLLIALALWAWPNREHLAAFPDIIASYTAKEYCSCRYVSANPAEYCQGYVKQWLPFSRLDDDQALKQITVTGLGRTHSATWLGERVGCQLQGYR